MTLEKILQKSFKYKKVFLKRRKKINKYISEKMQEPCYEYLTKQGVIAYKKLVDLLYDLEQILGKEFNASHWIDELDKIVDNEKY